MEFREGAFDFQTSQQNRSGDATVAGLTAAIQQGLSDEAVLKQGNVLGMLNAQEATTGYVQLANYQKLYDQILVEKV